MEELTLGLFFIVLVSPSEVTGGAGKLKRIILSLKKVWLRKKCNPNPRGAEFGGENLSKSEEIYLR